MKRTAAFIAILAAAILGFLLFRSRSTTPPVATSQAPRAPAVRPFPKFEHARKTLLQPQVAEPLRTLAAGLRYRARTERAALGQLLSDLRDSSLQGDYRGVVALVLGTLDDDEAQRALATELQVSRDPVWTAILLHALGAEKGGENDELFDSEGSPYAYDLAGLNICIKTDLRNEMIRTLVATFLSDPNEDVRRAAARATAHSCRHDDLRRVFAERMLGERDDGIRAGYGHAMAQWAVGESQETAGREEIIGRIIEGALRPEDAALRFRTEEPLGRAALSTTQTQLILDLALKGSPSQQIWSLSILKEKVTSAGPELEPSCIRLTSPDQPPKVREYAAVVLSRIRTDGSSSALINLLHDPTWNVRAAAARSLEGRAAAVVALTQIATSDPDDRVRQAANQTLRQSVGR